MAESLNPFEENDLIENEIKHAVPESKPSAEVQQSTELTWDSVAAKLLKDNFLLTALELYTELVESGRDMQVPRLRDYFSNPGNFERTKEDTPSPTLPRTSSVQTFDSLDFARYSDDGGGQVDERVAVLEFELRKAQEAIKNLRATLTKEAESEITSPEGNRKGQLATGKEETIRPLEKRALNFVVNEYLLLNEYKITSVTFAEENEDQDFEDWDDVGLNIPRPPGLLHLFRDYGSHVTPKADTCEIGCQANLDDSQHALQQEEWGATKADLECRISELEADLRVLIQQNEVLSQQVKIFKESPPQITLTKPGKINSRSHTPTRQYQPPPEPRPDTEGSEITTDSAAGNSVPVQSHPPQPLNLDKGENCEAAEEYDSGDGGSRPAVTITRQVQGEGEMADPPMSPEWMEAGEVGRMSVAFKKALRDMAFHISHDNRIVAEVSKIDELGGDGLVSVLASCLPHIVPNILLAKREELIPLILCAAMLHPEPKQRDQLLNILFNLIKKPDEEQRHIILTGCIAYARHAGPTRLEAELLPQCWEQINHKYVERRILVAEACGTLASYLPPAIRSSLVLSMLQQMLGEDRAEEVREAVVRSLGLLTGFITDPDKYTQGCELLRIALKDSSERVQNAALTVFLPTLAAWSMSLGRLEHHLLHSLLRQLEDLVKATPSRPFLAAFCFPRHLLTTTYC